MLHVMKKRRDISLYIRKLFIRNLSHYRSFSLLDNIYGFISCECLCMFQLKEIK